MTFLDRYGPWAIVTGASSGIGEAFSNCLAERGLNLVITARRGARLEDLARTLRQRHSIEVAPLELDLTDPAFLDTLLAATATKEIGLIVSNAGFGFKGLHHDQDHGQLDALINVNARAPTLIANAYSPQLIARGRGGLIITGSVEGFFSSPWSAAYAASKAYVHALGEALWDELKPYGIDVLVAAPGATDTENLKLEGFDAARMKNVMTPRQVADIALADIAKGPVRISGRINRAMVCVLGLIPRRTRIGLVGKGTKAAMTRSATSG